MASCVSFLFLCCLTRPRCYLACASPRGPSLRPPLCCAPQFVQWQWNVVVLSLSHEPCPQVWTQHDQTHYPTDFSPGWENQTQALVTLKCPAALMMSHLLVTERIRVSANGDAQFVSSECLKHTCSCSSSIGLLSELWLLLWSSKILFALKPACNIL